jgi:DNA polymerase-3 subunit delta'
VLAHPDPRAPAVQNARTLFVDPSHPVFHRVAAEAHPDLLSLYRTVGDTGKLRTEIVVGQVRKTVGFFGSTAGEGGWRVCIVDTADELNAAGANALLKIMEEPPARSLLLLVSHAPGRLLPTIRSRCRKLMLRPLSAEEVAHATATATGRSADEPDVMAAADAAGGSVGRALAFLDGDSLALRNRVSGLLAGLPAVDQRELHALGDEIAGTDAAKLATFTDAVRDWLAAKLHTQTEPARLAEVAEVWEKVNRAARDAETYNLDRKPLVFSVFGWLAGGRP